MVFVKGSSKRNLYLLLYRFFDILTSISKIYHLCMIHTSQSQNNLFGPWAITALQFPTSPSMDITNRLRPVCLCAEEKKRNRPWFVFIIHRWCCNHQRWGGGDPSSVPSPRKHSPRCLSVVTATGQRKMPMETKGLEEGWCGDDKDRRGRRRSVSWDLHDLTGVKKFTYMLGLNMNEQLCGSAYMNMLLVSKMCFYTTIALLFHCYKLNINGNIHWRPVVIKMDDSF